MSDENEYMLEGEMIVMSPKALLDLIEQATARGMRAGAQMVQSDRDREISTYDPDKAERPAEGDSAANPNPFLGGEPWNPVSR